MRPETQYNLDLFKTQLGMASSLKGIKGQAAGKGEGEGVDTKKWKAALDFQAMFLGQMYKTMRKSSMGGELTQASPGREIFSEMLDQEYARMDSRNPLQAGSQGMQRAAAGLSNSLAAQVYRALLRQDGDAVPPIPAGAPEPLPLGPALAATRSLGKRRDDVVPAPSLPAAALDKIVDLASDTYGVARNLIRGIIGQESAGKPHAVSPAGAKGLMQLMDTTARDLGVKNVFNPEENVLAGTRYLKKMLDRFGGDEKLALAAYNAGPGAVDRFGGVPPYVETRDYVEKVLKAKAGMDAAEGAR